MFKFFVEGNNPFRQATQGLAKASLITGLMLIGFGLLLIILKEVFIFIAAAIFFLMGFSAIGYAIRLFIVQWKMRKQTSVYREGVEVHFKEEM